MTKRIACAVLTLALLAPSSRPPAVSYTNAQAARGRFVYYERCAECHGGHLEGSIGPALAGPDARSQWETGQYVYSYFSVHMPHGAPGTLPTQDYVDIMAFLYQRHGRPAGARALDAATIKADSQPLGGG